MHAIFEKANQGLNIIIFYLVLIGVLSISARLIVRYKLKNSNKSRREKRVFEDLAALVVAGLLGIIMLQTLGHMK